MLPSEADLLPQDDEFRTSRSFDLVETPRFITEFAYDTAAYLDLIGTYSETLAATPAQQALLRNGLRTLIDRDFGGRVTKRYAFTTVLARRA